MSQQKVTRDQVFSICDQMQDEGNVPSVISIRLLTKEGSRTTIDRYLDEWRDQKKDKENFQIKMPSELQKKSVGLIEELWSQFNRMGSQQVQAMRDAANKELEQVRLDYAETLDILDEMEEAYGRESSLKFEADAKIKEYELRIRTLEAEIKLLTKSLGTCMQDAKQKTEQKWDQIVLLEREVSSQAKDLANTDNQISALKEKLESFEATNVELVTERNQIYELTAKKEANFVAENKRLEYDNRKIHAELTDAQQHILLLQEREMNQRESAASANGEILALRLILESKSSFMNNVDNKA